MTSPGIMNSMKRAFITLGASMAFMAIAVIIICVISIVLQAIFNPEARKDWQYGYYFIKYIGYKASYGIKIKARYLYGRMLKRRTGGRC